MNNPVIYIAWIAAMALLGYGLGWAIGLGIGAALFMGYAIAVDCSNGLIKAIIGNRK